jgi:hypothetical protein
VFPNDSLAITPLSPDFTMLASIHCNTSQTPHCPLYRETKKLQIKANVSSSFFIGNGIKRGSENSEYVNFGTNLATSMIPLLYNYTSAIWNPI